MGGELVRLAYTTSFQLDEWQTPLLSNERAVLVFMCSTAMDGDSPPRYWAGREALARYALGRVVPSDSDENKNARRSIFESVRQAVEGLVAKGVIARVGSAYPGRSQEYTITLDQVCKPSAGEQGALVPFASSPCAISKESLSMAQGDIGPETKETQTQRDNPDSSKRAPYVLPVDNTKAA